MHASNVQAAVDAAKSTAIALGLRVDDATVLQNSNRLALRLLPCDVVARVAPLTHQAGAEFEVEVGRRLGRTTSPVAGLDTRVEPRTYRGTASSSRSGRTTSPFPLEDSHRSSTRVRWSGSMPA